MSWEDAYRDHEVWSTIRATIDDISKYDGEIDDDVQRLNALLAYAEGFKDTPNVSVSPMYLNALNTSLNEIYQRVPDNVPAVFAGNNSNQPSLMTKFAQNVRSMPVSGGARLNGLGRRAEAVESLLGALSTRITSRTAELDEAISDGRSEFQETLQEHKAAVEQSATTAIASISEKVAQLEVELDRVLSAAAAAEATTQQQKSRLDEALTSHQEKFAAAQEQRTLRWNELVEASQKRVDDHMRKMDVHEEQSRKVLANVGVNATASDYQAYADAQAKTANRWRVGAVIAYSVAALIFFATVLLPLFNVQLSQEWWEAVIQKVGAPGGAAAIGFFLQREAAQHRQQERDAKHVQLTLTALEPFIANLEPEEQRSIRMETARDIFTQRQGQHAQVVGGAREASGVPEAPAT